MLKTFVISVEFCAVTVFQATLVQLIVSNGSMRVMIHVNFDYDEIILLMQCFAFVLYISANVVI